jgi:hypothetical protein
MKKSFYFMFLFCSPNECFTYMFFGKEVIWTNRYDKVTKKIKETV